jgi:Ser/Thr protein kinase RdoA (MazF antagonist)
VTNKGHDTTLQIGGLLRALGAWDLPVLRVDALGGGRNSATWLVGTRTGSSYVAKLADHHDARPFMNGLRISAYAAARGFASGPPVVTRSQKLALPLPEGMLALLEHVAGRHPDPASAEDMSRVGRTLARAHRTIRDCPIDLGPDHEWPWRWVATSVNTIPMPDWIREAITRVWSEARYSVGIHRLQTTLIHSDPGTGSFLLNDAAPDRDGLIDWATPLRGPTGYDLASLQVLLASQNTHATGWCIGGYLDESPEIGNQLPHLPLQVRVRWMAHAIYFASRIDRGIVRGVHTADANQAGLVEAYRGMCETREGHAGSHQ